VILSAKNTRNSSDSHVSTLNLSKVSKTPSLQDRGLVWLPARLLSNGYYRTCIVDSLLKGEQSRYITNTNTKVYSAFHPSGVGKSSTGLSDWGGARSPVSGGSDPIWQVMLHSSAMGFLQRAILFSQSTIHSPERCSREQLKWKTKTKMRWSSQTHFW